MNIRDMPRLVRGAGAPGDGACWMSALAWLSGEERWTDDAKCVDPVIRGLCIVLNDKLPDDDREAVIGPHLFAPYGTNQGREWTERRLVVVVRFALAEAAHALSVAGLTALANSLRAIRVESPRDYAAAASAADAAAVYADRAVYAAAAAYAAARAAAYAAVAASGGGGAIVAASAVYAAHAGGSGEAILGLILELCAMGREEREDVERPRNLAGLCEIVPRAEGVNS